MEHKNSSTNSNNINNAILNNHISILGYTKLIAKQKPYKYVGEDFTCKSIAKTIMDTAYLLSTYKIHCIITPTNHMHS